jgi:hypothetical protein
MKESSRRWESILDEVEEKEFKALLKDLCELRKVKFLGCITPREGQYKPLMTVFGDTIKRGMLFTGLRWEMEDGG